MNFILKKLSRNKKTKKTKNRRKKQIGLTRRKPNQYKQYKKIFKGGFPPRYAEVLKKYYYIFGDFIFDSILDTKIFNNSDHIDALILYLTKKTKSKTLNNESQVTEILKPALTEFVDNVVRKNQSGESKIIRVALFTMSTKTILNTLLGPKTIQKILEKSPPDKLIETFISDLEILKMKVEDKEEATKYAKATSVLAAPTTLAPVKKTPTESSSEKKEKTKKKEKLLRSYSDDHFGIMAAKPKSRRLIVRRKKRETYKN